MNRPTGVTVIAILYMIGAAFCVVLGVLMFVGGGFMATMMNQQASGGSGVAGILAGLGAALGVVVLVFGAIDAVVGWGLWSLKEWGRIMAIILSALGALLQLPGLLRALTHFHIFGIVWVGFWLAIHILIIVYLLKPETKAAFR